MTQREDRTGIAAIQQFKAHLDATRPGWEGQVSGAQIHDFRQGWAKLAMAESDVAHHFRRMTFDRVIARCGFKGEVRWLFGQGSFKRCRLCQRSVDRSRL